MLTPPAAPALAALKPSTGPARCLIPPLIPPLIPGAAARAAFEAGEAALRAGQTLNAGRWLRLSRSLLALGRDLEALARQKAAAKPLFTPGVSPEDIADENAYEADVMAIVLAREAGQPEPEPRYKGSLEDADFYIRLRAAQRAGLFDEEAFRRGELDLDELDLDAWLPPACRRDGAASDEAG